MYDAAGEMVFQCSDFFQDSHQHCYLRLLEEEFLSTLHGNALIGAVQEKIHEDLHLSFIGDPSTSDLVAGSSISDYQIGGEEFLFESPETIIEEPLLPLHSVTEAISTLPDVEDIIPGETITSAETDSLETNPLLDEIYRKLTEDLLVKPANEKPETELNAKLPAVQMESMQMEKEVGLHTERPLQKSLSSGCLTPNNSISGWPTGLGVAGFQGMDLGAAFRMRRAYSEGDIKNLGNRVPQVPAMVGPFINPCLITMEGFKSEERMQKLIRYRKKKFKRNFGRKIKYECRKALADSQPRVRGRFARTEEVKP